MGASERQARCERRGWAGWVAGALNQIISQSCGLEVQLPLKQLLAEAANGIASAHLVTVAAVG